MDGERRENVKKRLKLFLQKIDATQSEQTIHESLLDETMQVIAASGDQPVNKLWTTMPSAVTCSKRDTNATSDHWLKMPAIFILASICLTVFIKFLM